MKTRILLLLAMCSASSCGSVAEAYVLADQATYQAIAPEYHQYVENDPNLTPEQRDRRLRTVETWRRRLASASQSSPSLPSR